MDDAVVNKTGAIWRTLILLTVLLIAAIACGCSAARASDAEAATQLVLEVMEQTTRSFAGQTLTPGERTARLRGLIDKYSDISLLSEDILGRYWSRSSADARGRFVGLLSDYAPSSYSNQLAGMAERLRFQTTITDTVGAGRYVVHSLAIIPTDTLAVDWTVAPAADGRLVIADVAVDGMSVIQIMKGDFIAFMRANGGKIDALCDALGGKLAAYAGKGP